MLPPIVAFDTETHLIENGKCQLPRLVCLQIYDRTEQYPPGGWSSEGRGVIYPRDCTLPVFAHYLQRAAAGQVRLLAHYAAFDLGVLLRLCYESSWTPEQKLAFTQLLFRVLDLGGVIDTHTCERLISLYHGDNRSLALGVLIERRFGLSLDKDPHGWRLYFSELEHIPIRAWPQRARDYALDDVHVLPAVWQHQQDECASAYPDDVLHDLPSQVRHAFALQLTASIGLPVDSDAYWSLHHKTNVEIATLRRELEDAGLVRNGSRFIAMIKDRVEVCLGLDAKTTEKGAISTDVVQLLRTGDPDLIKVARYNGLTSKVRQTYLKWLAQGLNHRITAAKSNSLLNTGRAALGLHMTLPRGGGLREVVRASPGTVFSLVDYDTAELRSLAQACLDVVGWSRLADVFQKPKADPHTEMAALIIGVSVEQAYAWKAEGDKRLPRQSAKAPNFGFPGGMGPDRFSSSQQELIAKHFRDTGEWLNDPPSVTEASRLKILWSKAWPEMAHMFAFVKDAIDRGNGVGRLKTPISNRYRGGLGFCDGANNQFQPRTANGALDALYNVTKVCYSEPSRHLYGSRPINFVHDEIMCEHPEWKASECVDEVSQIMIESMQPHTAQIPVGTDPTLTTIWSKKAKSKQENGRWTVWNG